MRAQARETASAMKNLSNTTVASEGYRKLVDSAVTAVQSGVEDYGSAIRHAIREAGGSGLRVKYESGQTRRLDTAIRMNTLGGVRHLTQQVLIEVGREFSADGVEIDAHMLCAEDHLPYQGRQFSNDEFEEIQSSLARPFGEWNCRHVWHPILLGVSAPTYTEAEREEMRRYSTEEVEIDGRTKTRYEWSQEMRRCEAAVRAAKDTANLAREAGDDELRRQCQRRINALNDHYTHLASTADLKPEYTRTYVGGFVDAAANGSAGPRILTTGLSAANLGDHERKMAGMVGKADATVRSVWNRNAARLNVLDAHYTAGNAHCEGSNGVRFDIDAIANGTGFKSPYQTAFHEFGHQIDFLNGSKGLPISYIYKNDLLSKTAMRESKEHLKEYFRKHFTKYYPSLTGRDILKAGPLNGRIKQLASQYDAGSINIDQVLTNQTVFDTLMALAGRQFEADYCVDVSAAYSERQLSDISDIFEPATKVDYPFGTGHRQAQPMYWYSMGAHATEIFADMYSAEIGNHASLETIKAFYPETYQVFREILEAIK